MKIQKNISRFLFQGAGFFPKKVDVTTIGSSKELTPAFEEIGQTFFKKSAKLQARFQTNCVQFVKKIACNAIKFFFSKLPKNFENSLSLFAENLYKNGRIFPENPCRNGVKKPLKMPRKSGQNEP